MKISRKMSKCSDSSKNMQTRSTLLYQQNRWHSKNKNLYATKKITLLIYQRHRYMKMYPIDEHPSMASCLNKRSSMSP